jgi:PBSX family phage terminase large subunit
MSEIRISEQIIAKYYPIFNDTTHKHIILTSGRAGTKSSYSAIKAIYQIVSDGKGSVVVLRKHHNKLRKTVYQEMLRGINRLGLGKKRFYITKSPMEIRYKRNGSTIYFTGSDSIDDTKGLIDESRPIKLLVLDELTEFFDQGEGEDELTNIEATFVRGNSTGFQMLYMYNPPKNPNAPINKWLEKMVKRDDTIHIHTTYNDVPASWLGNDLIESARQLQEADSKMYRWVWLGESQKDLDKLIYYMFDTRHIKDIEADARHPVLIGGDYGQMNPTTFQAFRFNAKTKKLLGIGEYFHSGRESGRQKSPSEYAIEFTEWARKLKDEYSDGKVILYLDPSAKGLAEEIRRKCNFVAIREADNRVSEGITRVQRLLTFDALLVSPTQKHLIEEFGIYEYDQKSIERGKETPVKENDHCMDALRYIVNSQWSNIKHFLPVAERGKANERSEAIKGNWL